MMYVTLVSLPPSLPPFPSLPPSLPPSLSLSISSQMFEHSRALAAHHRRQSTEEPSQQQQQPAGTGPETHGSQGEGVPATGGAGGTGGGAITHSMLATALSGAISAQDSSLMSSSQDLSSTALSR